MSTTKKRGKTPFFIRCKNCKFVFINLKFFKMKKAVLFFFLIISLASCRITKTLEMINAKANAKETEQQFVNNKMDAIRFLNLSESQKAQCETIWKKEKLKLAQINLEENKEIAPVVYESEVEFRKVLTSDQLTSYKKTTDSRIEGYFINDHALGELKRIYNL